jgi:hypothetical protein
VVSSKKTAGINANITQQKEKLKPNEVEKFLDESFVFLDLLRPNQTGLSFRVFEALAHQKKLITTNAAIKEYDFYNPNNIIIIDSGNVNIDPAFFKTPYKPLPEALYNKYTISNFVDTVFFS